MKDQRITLETAKLAKEKNFNIPINGEYTEYLVNQVDPSYPEGGGAFSMTKGEVEFTKDFFKNNWKATDFTNESYAMYAAPTQALLARWFREKHEIHIEIYSNASGWGWILTKLNGTGIKEIEDDIFFASHELALEEGLRLALNIIT